MAIVAAGPPAGLSLRICVMGRPLCAAPREPGAASPRSSLLRGLRGRAPTSSGDRARERGCQPRAETVQPRGHQKTEDGVEHRSPPTPGRPGAAHLRGARDRPDSGRGEVRNRNCAPSGRGALLLPTPSAGAPRGEGARLACVNRGPPGAAALEGPPGAFYPNNSKGFQGSSRHARDFVVGSHQEACSGSGVDVCSRGFVLPRVGWGRALDDAGYGTDNSVLEGEAPAPSIFAVANLPRWGGEGGAGLASFFPLTFRSSLGQALRTWSPDSPEQLQPNCDLKLRPRV
ncbi:hypothetical protein J1605_020501 [Eschrichtius robustus]|uniref:Uncharacterized protein n=1 Tax=Eschrichtius robustus TaxID=9764 RepID=A0AB34HMN8_ESCRO|nr:hypothetical protein J1605_020501 [Eschrichtius robustus]